MVAMFLSDQNFFNKCERGPPKNQSCQIIMKSIEPFWRRGFLKVHYMLYSENKPRIWRPCFLFDENFFKISKRGPPKELSCQIIMKSIKPFWRRWFLKFQYMLYSENKPRPRRPCFCQIKISSRNLKEVHPRNIHAKLYWNPFSHFGGDDF